MRVLLGLLVVVLGAAGQVPDLFSLAGRPEVAAYSSEPLARVGTIPTQADVRFFFAHPDGLRYYAISYAGPEGVWVISTAAPYPVLKKLAVAEVVAAAMSPDGKRMVLIESTGSPRQYTLAVLSLESDTVLARIKLPNLARETVAISHDSSRAYFLTVSPGLLYTVDLRTNTLGRSPMLFPIAEEVRVAPNGLVYVAAGQNLVAVNGLTMTPVNMIPLTLGRTIGLGFDPDGEYAFSNVDVINLKTLQATPWTTNRGGALLGGVIPLGNRRAIGRTDVEVGFSITAEPVSSTALPRDTSWIAATNEYPAGRYLFGVSDRRLRRYPQAGQIAPVQELPVEVGSVVYAERPGGGSPARVLGFNTAQSIRGDEVPRPLVARVLDGLGHPLHGVSVMFRSSIVMATVMSNRDGYAQVDIPAGMPAGSYAVTATAGGAPPVTYDLTYSERPVGPARLTVVSGAGQYHNGFHPAAPIVLQARDSLGRPWPGLAVRFRLLAAAGTLGAATQATCADGECTVWADANGLAAVDYYIESGKLPSQVVLQTIAANGGGASIEVPATVFPRFNTPELEFSAPAGELSGLAGTTIPNAIRLRARLRTSESSAVPFSNLGVVVETAARDRKALCAVLTDGNGDATCSLQLPEIPGKYELRVSVGGLSVFHARRAIPLTVYANQPQVEFHPGEQVQTGAERTFEISASHPGTETPFGILNLLVNDSLDGRRACYVAYSVAERQVYLVKDDGPGAGLVGPLPLSGNGSIENSQCTVLSEGSSMAGTVERPVLRLRVRFSAAFAGPKLLYVAGRTRNDTATSGWIATDLVSLPVSGPAGGPAVLPQESGRWSGVSREVVFRYQSGDGGRNLQTVWGLAGSSLDARGACYFAYYVPGSSLTLFADNGVPASAPVEVTSGTSLANSQCRIWWVTPEYAGGTLQLRMVIETKAAFAGTQVVWGAASTLQNAVSPWTPLAVWRVDP